MGKHIKPEEVAGIVRDIQDGKKYTEIMYSWDISYSTFCRMRVAMKLVEKRATPEEIYAHISNFSISATIADWVTEEIDRIKREEEEAARVAENAIVELENAAVESARRVLNPDEIIYSLMRIEDLLGKMLECWGGAVDGGKV